jgi:hypothetical protein
LYSIYAHFGRIIASLSFHIKKGISTSPPP